MSDKNLRIRVLLDAMDRVSAPLRKISGGAGKASAKLKETRDRLKELERVQKDIAAFRGLKASLDDTTAALADQQRKAQELGAKYRALEAPTRAQTREFDKQRAAVAALKIKQQDEARQLQELRTRLQGAGVAANSMAQAERRLRGDISRTTSEIAQQEDRLKRLNLQRERAGRARAGVDAAGSRAAGFAAGGAGMIGAGGALGVPLLAAKDDAVEFESTMTDIAQKTDMARRSAELMGVRLRTIAVEANKFPEEIQAGIDTLTGFGIDSGIAEKLIKPIARASTAYKAEVDDLAAAQFAAYDNLKVPLEKSSRVLEVMALAGKKGAFEIKDMAAEFPTLTASAKGLGQEGVPAVADLAAALQIVRKGTGDSASAANNLNNLLQKIGSPGTVKAFAKMGINLEAEMKKAAAAGKTPIEAIAEATNKALKGDLGKLGYLFEDAQVQQALRPLIQNMDLYRQIRADALGAKGVVDADFVERMRDAKQVEQSFLVGLKDLSLELGGQLKPAFADAVGAITPFLKGATDWIRANPALAGGIAKVAAGVAIFLVVMGGIALAVAAVLGPFAMLNLAWVNALPILGLVGKGMGVMLKVLPLLGRAFLMFGAAAARAGVMLLFNPITWIVLAIVAAVALLAAGAYLIVKNWGPISAWFGRLWQGIMAWASKAFEFVKGVFLNFTPLGLLIKAFAAVWPWLSSLGAKFAAMGGHLIMGLVTGITSKLGAIKGAIIGAAKAAIGWFKGALGIKSPSRVFAGLGDYTMQGLAVGLKKGERGPLEQIRSSAGRITKAMAIGATVAAGAGALPAAAAAPGSPGGAQGGGGDRYEVHFHATAGMDEKALFALFEAWVAKRDAKKAAAGRSALADYDD